MYIFRYNIITAHIIDIFRSCFGAATMMYRPLVIFSMQVLSLVSLRASWKEMQKTCRKRSEDWNTVCRKVKRIKTDFASTKKHLFHLVHLYAILSDLRVCFRNFPTQIFSSSTHVYHSLPWSLPKQVRKTTRMQQQVRLSESSFSTGRICTQSPINGSRIRRKFQVE